MGEARLALPFLGKETLIVGSDDAQISSGYYRFTVRSKA
jgi:hypothetical protein